VPPDDNISTSDPGQGDAPSEDEAPPPEIEYTRPVFGFIDAHADTITKAMERGQGLFRNNLHVDFERLYAYGAPIQVFTVWCDDEYVNNAFEYANSAIDFFESELERHNDIIELALSLSDLERNARNNKISAILALEGGEPLMGLIENLDHFYNRGVRLITLTWNRSNELGYGVGSGSNAGLTPFGVDCVRRMNELGIIIDVSHLNEAGFWDVDRLSTRPYIASHSNAYSVAQNSRNLSDRQITAIVNSGGMIGINLYPPFLSNNRTASMNNIMRHINHFIGLGAGGNIGLGCDFDGIGSMPTGFSGVSSLGSLANAITDELGADVSESIMSGNFYEYFVRFFDS